MKKFKSIIFLVFAFTLLLFLEKSQAAKFSISPASDSFTQECVVGLTVQINTEGQASNSADIEIRFNPAQIEVIDANGVIPGVQITNGDAYESYFGNTVNNSTGIIKLTGASFGLSLNGSGEFASFEIKSKPSITNANLNIYYTGVGNTTDSNIASKATSNDLLSGVTNGSYTFTSGICNPDTTPPTVNFINPSGSNDQLAGQETITVKIFDSGDGIDLASLSVTLDGEVYNVGDGDLQITGDAGEYTLVITPRFDLVEGVVSFLNVTIADFAGNTTNKQLIFNYPAGEALPSTGVPGEPGIAQECSVDQQIFDTITNLPLISNILDSALVNTISEQIPDSIKQLTRELSAPGVASLALSAGLLANGLTFLMLLRSPQVLLAILGLSKKKKPWGVVMDAATGKPVPFAVLRLYVHGSKAMITQTVSDTHGKYGFIIDPGKYRLNVQHPEYAPLEMEINITDVKEGVVQDIKLAATEKLSAGNRYKRIMRSLNQKFQALSPTLTYIGLATSIFAMLIKPNLINGGLLAVYSILSAIYLYRRFKSQKFWGSVYDSKSNLLIPNALVKIFDQDTWQLVNTAITDNKGRFPIQPDPGDYAVLASAGGYNFPSKKQKDLELIDKKLGGLLAYQVKQGQVPDLELFIDPTKKKGFVDGTKSQQEDTGNLPSPF